MSPYELERKSFHNVIRLYSDVRRMQIRIEKENDPNRVIMVKASDNWF